MGCGPSTAAEVHSRNSGGRDPPVEVVPVATRSVPLVLSMPYKHGSAITQVRSAAQELRHYTVIPDDTVMPVINEIL